MSTATSEAHNVHRRSVPELIRTAKAFQEKAEHAAEKAEQFYVSFGLTLAELKDRKPEGTPWPAFVKKYFDIGRSRADELIQIAHGKTTVENVREGKRERMRRVRTTDTPPRGGGSNGERADTGLVAVAHLVVTERQAKRIQREAIEFDALPIREKINAFIDEIKKFEDDVIVRLVAWHELNPKLSDEARAALVLFLSQASMRLQQAAQQFDGR